MENDSLLINLKEIFLKAGLSEDKALSVYSEDCYIAIFKFVILSF